MDSTLKPYFLRNLSITSKDVTSLSTSGLGSVGVPNSLLTFLASGLFGSATALSAKAPAAAAPAAAPVKPPESLLAFDPPLLSEVGSAAA